MPSFRTKEFIFTHFYKTGGVWFYYVWKKLNLSPILETAPVDAGHQPITFFKDWQKLPSIVFYRNPLDWYGSLYSYHIKTDWQWVPDLKGIPFYDFVKFYLSNSPMCELWNTLILEPQNGRTNPRLYMVQYERMHEDLEIILNTLGFNITKEQLYSFPALNAGPADPPKLSLELKEEILKTDKLIFSYYH